MLMMFIFLRMILFLLGMWLVIAAVLSAVRTFVLPRGAADVITRSVFIYLRMIFELRSQRAITYEQKDRIMELYAPFGLLLLLVTWLVMILLGYTAMFWALVGSSLYDAFKVSGSSLYTLGVAFTDTFPTSLLSFTEAAIGLVLVALLISYLPTIYAAFSRREAMVTLLEVRAGSPPSAVEMIIRFHRIHHFNNLSEMWASWEKWFVEVEESHTSLASLSFFRSPQPHRHWVTAAGTVLDGAALINAAVDIPHDSQADLCIRAGYVALRDIADFFLITYKPNPSPTDPISVRKEEFDAALERLEQAGVPLKADRDQAWRDFAGWRVNYDTVLLALAELLLVPPTTWISDRYLANAPRVVLRYRGRKLSQKAGN